MPPIRRVVFDPNVLISGAISSRAAPAALVDLIDAGIVVPVVCPTLLDELRSVLQRPKLRRYFDAEQAAAYVDELVRRAEEHDDPVDVAAVSSDPNDDYLIALARAARANALVSGDQDVTEISLDDVAIQTPRQLLNNLTDDLAAEAGD